MLVYFPDYYSWYDNCNIGITNYLIPVYLFNIYIMEVYVRI